jgi:hypothetical protein
MYWVCHCWNLGSGIEQQFGDKQVLFFASNLYRAFGFCVNATNGTKDSPALVRVDPRKQKLANHLTVTFTHGLSEDFFKNRGR